ncbi:MAG: hypothetical protein AAFZ15_33645, partial [Bacteroidota bacterium]
LKKKQLHSLHKALGQMGENKKSKKTIMKNSKNLILILFLIGAVQFVFISCEKEGGSSQMKCQADTFFADTCVFFNVKELETTQDSLEYFITNNAGFTISFEHKWEAEKALDVIENYEFNEYCTIGSEKLFAYFLTDGQIPEGGFFGEDCVPHEVCDLKVELTSSGYYTVVEEGHWAYASETEEGALHILKTIQYFQSNFGCFVGRPKTNMQYIRK